MGKLKPILLTCVMLYLFAEVSFGAVSKKTDPEVLSQANWITIPFVENKGQLEDPNTLFYSDIFVGRVSVNRDGSIGYYLAGKNADDQKQITEITKRLCGALKTAPSGAQKATARVSYFRGKDPQKWVTDIPTFDCVNMGEITPGISLKLKAHGNNVEKIISVLPGADPQKIQLLIEGAKELRLTAEGELEVHTGAGSLRFSQPLAYQWIDGKKAPVDVAYTIKGRSYGFKLAAYDQTKELIIDPLITAIFAGTTGEETRPSCMAADSQGNIYVAGKSAGQLAVFKFDIGLEKLLGSALFGKYLDGWPYRNIFDIAIDDQDAIYLVGGTMDSNFPVTEGAFDTEIGGGEGEDGFVIKFNADLNTILASTFIGKKETDVAFGLTLDPNDNVYVVGMTVNPDFQGDGPTPFPTSPGAYDTDPGEPGKTKAFIARLDSELKNLGAATLLGYNGDENSGDFRLQDRVYDVAIDADGNVVVAGETQSTRFPVTSNCADAKFGGRWESFISKFDPNLQNLLASTFLGGANDERINVLQIDSDNKIVIAGWTTSSDFPVIQDNFDTSYNLYEDGFVSRLNSELTTIEASTFLGGDGTEQVSDMVIYEDGRVLLCGGTGSSNFPITDNAHDDTFNGPSTNDFYKGDGFITIFDPTFTTCSESTFLGGRFFDHIVSVLLNNQDIVLAGETSSDNFPYVVELKGDSDAFVCRFNTDETPQPLPSAGSGHWLSKSYVHEVSSLYLDIDICEDGSFRGTWDVYICAPGCVLRKNPSFEPIFGTIDFEKKTGLLNMPESEGCMDIPFVIDKQTSDYLRISINPGEELSNCYGSTKSVLYYQGESENGKCDDEPIGPGENPGGGGGSGGCFMSIFDDSGTCLRAFFE
jgi:hypothetical protein